jgi:hypothetical protein
MRNGRRSNVREQGAELQDGGMEVGGGKGEGEREDTHVHTTGQ